MPLYADATAPKALGLLGLFPLLRHYASDVVIPNALLYELRVVGQPLQDALTARWLRIEPHSNTTVDYYMDVLGLDRGEAELIDLLRNSPTKGKNIALIDEGKAFEQIAGRATAPQVICLADVLTSLEGDGHIASAEQAMRDALDNRYYFWAWNVHEDYVKRCAAAGIAPLPR